MTTAIEQINAMIDPIYAVFAQNNAESHARMARGWMDAQWKDHLQSTFHQKRAAIWYSRARRAMGINEINQGEQS